jgi:predicted phage terminase large subunit-like protein
VFFGGAAGGGKSVALLMAACQYTDVPGYNALLLRPSLVELQLAGGLIDLSHDWFSGSKARWSGDTKTWRFPGRGRSGAGGATIAFGYLADDGALSRYAGSSFSFIGFDELTRFHNNHYTRMFRALRQPRAGRHGAAPDGTNLADVPLRVRSTSNPGGPGHSWVKQRFIDPEARHPGVVYLPSQLADNPYLDRDAYSAALAELPNAERERLLHGNWEIPDDGELFRRDWIELIEPHQLPPTQDCDAVRFWDLAATAPSPANPDPDYTVGLLLYWHRDTGTYYIADIVRDRLAPGAVENLVHATAQRDGKTVQIRIEKEPGAAGVAAADRYIRHILAGYAAKALPASGDKTTRATPAAAAAENGLYKLARNRHTNDFLDELTSFPHGRHDDCVDALAGAHNTINPSRYTTTFRAPKGRIQLPDPTSEWRPDPLISRDRRLEDFSRRHGVPIHHPRPSRRRRLP